MGKSVFESPSWIAALCAVGATLLGLAYMYAAGAPLHYLTMNIGALIIGFILAGIAAQLAKSVRFNQGLVSMALGAILLLTSLSGSAVEGATRWIAVGGLFIQPSLLLIPVMVTSFARTRDGLSTIAMMVAALALAIQPDRAMSGALAAALIALALLRPERNVVITMAAALFGFAATMLQPDNLPAVPYVDQIIYSSFGAHPLAGLAVLAGLLLLLVPAMIGRWLDSQHGELYVVFGMVWLAIILAAAMGNYPTPIVGYGGSAIIGYVVSVIGLPKSMRAAAVDAGGSNPTNRDASPPASFHNSLAYSR